ncbi:hypothetical protein AALA79_01925 [Lachnospiraceae bacterium 64-25]
MQDIEYLTRLVTEENDKLKPVLGEVPAGRMELRAFLMERYLDAIKSDSDFSNEIYQAINEVMTFRTYSTKAHQKEDPEQVMRRLEVAAMIDRMKERR